ncbi:hypothetical protein ARAM_006066 [Aspergillus rambellii]|uniref:Carrier domain-containing protein n=1 Tax=Aspergillus rambellii TaxID=308745 RepID=A0A0F8VMV9_9EURO|nr:hypothetical protein ARAM_006066 [Aspergillus rambellii]
MKRQQNEPIAIIGSGCRFPGNASSPSKLWDLLREPKDCLSEIPRDRFNWEGYHYGDGPRHGSSTTKYTHFLKEDIRKFDPHFFNIQPGEADAIDPQQRLLLETVYEGLESAGLTIEGLQGSSTAVYVGMMGCDYADVIQKDVDCTPTYAGTGTARSIHSNRISYFFDWHGPSMTIDTACSSSMMAIHLAIQSLRNGDSQVAVACGTSIIIGPHNYVVLSNLNMIAADGRAKMWDVDANGYARGEGVGAVILKTLSAAEADGDYIECVIRETSVNQDGRTRGITMPSSTAQAELIRQTYERAGLDLSKREDRPQYFEAHGTGTMVGDPREAEAVHNAFFTNGDLLGPEDTIYIGSIKTVIGHTEGAAGLAGVLKASLALQNGLIPPNLLFNRLSPAVAPFAKHLQLPTALTPWPALPDALPRRASVNSFGFGGSNGHAILESYQGARRRNDDSQSPPPVTTPFVFSAQSERTLISTLERFSEYLKANKTVCLRDVSWSLQYRRSTLPVRTVITALTVDDLLSKLTEKLSATQDQGKVQAGVKSLAKHNAQILGVFTGQGAQWAGMGREILRISSVAREIVRKLDDSLSQLAASDRPPWTIEEELSKDTDTSRIGEASISQPLCTAVQILLVDMLEAAGVRFHAVVGHSSGEIAAAYAAKLLTASDAIRIAYYRGVCAKLARGADGQLGSMMAVGTSMDDARELCAVPDFEGRLSIAACNSSTSITLSGDKEAIDGAKLVFDEEKKFARVLKVDTAYHSHHMQPCAEPYLAALQACNIQPLTPGATAPIWLSSVYGGKRMTNSPDLSAAYWVSNMTQAVLFSSAVESALAMQESLDLALEIGPHPALQAPAMQTIQDTYGTEIPYTGVLSRGKHDLEVFSGALGFVWTHCERNTVQFAPYNQHFFPCEAQPVFVKDLPTYPWDHERSYWFESRTEKAQRYRSGPVHPLLGVPYGDTTESEIKWRNFLTPKELPWLLHHQLQGQAVFPAAASAAMAWEAALLQVGEQPVRLIEVTDLVIHRSISFQSETTSVEVVLTLLNMHRRGASPGERFTADWSLHSPLTPESEKLAPVASGSISLLLGAPTISMLPVRGAYPPNMVRIDADEFYAALSELGYGYTGPFQSITHLERKLNYSSGTFEAPTCDLLVHPAMLDMAFQALFAAVSYPGDGGLWSLHVPTSIRGIRINPYHCPRPDDLGVDLSFDAILAESSSKGTAGDVVIFSADGRQGLLQVEGVSSVPFTRATRADDRNIFSEEVWNLAEPHGPTAVLGHRATPEELEHAYACERVAHFYLKRLREEITPAEESAASPHHQRLMAFAKSLVSGVASGNCTYAKAEWANDTEPDIIPTFERYPDSIDLKIMRSVGEAYPSVVRGQSNPLEHLTKDNMLDDFYTEGLGFQLANTWAGRLIKQISHRYPHMNIIEIGAGTGGATKTVLEHLGQSFRSYTYTDVSTAFFEKAQERFKDHAHKMIFKPFDMEKEPGNQSLEAHSFDLVVASNVLHATKDISQALHHVRALLRPGGYLVLLEITDQRPSRMGFIMGGLPGWWQGEGRRQWTPTLPPAQWNSLLQKTGYSGIDTIALCPDSLPYPFSVSVAQAVDDGIAFLRQPLFSAGTDKDLGDLLIIGGSTLESSKLATGVMPVLRPRFGTIAVFESLEDLQHDSYVEIPSTVLVLVDIDEPIFQDMTALKLQALKTLFQNARNVVWVTKGCKRAEPYANMTVGLGRSLSCEMHELRLQFLDIEEDWDLDVGYLSEMLLRLRVTDLWESSGPLSHEILWTTEPEFRAANSKILIPRMYEHSAQNDRYNSQRRQISHEQEREAGRISISHSGAPKTFKLVEDRLSAQSTRAGMVSIRVLYSVLSAMQVADGAFLFLSIGRTVAGGDTVLAVSDSNSSTIDVPKEHMVRINVPKGDEKRSLLLAAWELIIHQALSKATTRAATILTRDVEKGPLQLLQHRATRLGIRAQTITSDPNIEDSGSIFIHPFEFHNTVKGKLTSGVVALLDLSQDPLEDSVHRLLVGSLPSFCTVLTTTTLLSPDASNRQFTGDFSNLMIQDVLAKVSSEMQDSSSTEDQLGSISICSLKELTQGAKLEPLQLIDWLADTHVPVEIEPVGSKVSFSPEKTYWLIGLTADLGQSLCEWLVAHGARHLVLSSRNPRVDQGWLDPLSSAGATIKVCSMDVTDKLSVYKTHEDILQTMPPIAGVANAAMVLQDIMFSNMKLDDLLPVLRPKVDGSQYLNDLFADQQLDFFILFSSLGLIVGNSGQSSYTAANAFMASLVAQRRQRGLSAAVMDIGAIIGAGYITRAGQIKAADLAAYGAYPLSTSDFHQMFGEAVLASHPESGHNPEIVTGLRMIDPVVDDRVSWRANPKFSHFWRTEDEFKTDSGTKHSMAPVKVQLMDATTRAQAREIIQECFSARLMVLLQLHEEDMDDNAALVELGVDSLVAVEARAWFTKQLGVDIPVLRMLGGASVVDLVDDALANIGRGLIPQVNLDHHDEPAAKANNSSFLPQETELISDPASSVASIDTPSSDSEQQGSSPTASSLLDDFQDGFNPVIVKTEPMSYAQSRFWFLRRSVEDPTAFNITFSHSLKGDAHPAELAKAVQAAARLHQGLRTCFFEKDNQPVQGILETSPLYLERRPISSEDEVKAEYHQLHRHEYDLESGRTMRIVLLEMGPRLSYLIVGYHHIAMDGAGFTGFLQELMRIGGGEQVPEPIQYADYSRELREAVEAGKMAREMAYWRKQLADIPPVLPLLPLSKVRVRAPLRTYALSSTSVRVDPVLVARIKRRSRNFQATAFHFYLTVFQTLLFRFLDIEDLCIGIADSNRSDADLQRTMGILVNLLPLRFKSHLSQTFSEAVKDARRTAYAGLDHSKLPFNVLLDQLPVERSATQFPIFQVFMDYRPGIQERLTLGNVEVQRLDWSYGKNAYDINLDIMENTEGSAFITMSTQDYLYGQTEVETLMKVYLTLLESFSRNPALHLNEPPLFNESEIQTAIDIGRGPSLPSDWAPTLSQRVEEIAQTHGRTVAVKDGEGNQITYQEMMTEAHRIAGALLDAGGIVAGDRVAVFQHPTATTTISSLLAILRVGAVYVPLDLRSPMPRLAAIIQDCQPKVILSHATTAKYASALASSPPVKLINVSTIEGGESPRVVPNQAAPDGNAVILYTSGSTGVPKGVILRHANIRNVVEATTKRFSLGAETVLQQSALTFDLSINQIFVALANGGTLYIVPQSKRGDAVEITKMIEAEHITYTLATPSEYSYWFHFGVDSLTAATRWKFAFSLGEELKPRLVEEFQALQRPDVRLINTYGPAEITVQSHAAEIAYGGAAEDVIPAGWSLPNYSVYIVDRDMKPLPVNIPGEICIGGAGVAAGYLNLEDQTQEQFLPDAFAPADWVAKGWNRMYRTGDRGRLRADGALLFDGRMDGSTQVKLRGLRIDLGEIEHAILQTASPALDEVVVSVRGRGDNNQQAAEFLVAHVVFSRGFHGDNNHETRQTYLQRILGQLPLPQYMVPAMMIPLDRMPLTRHHKTDRQAIAAIPLPKDSATAAAGTESAQDLTPLETELVRIWEVVLSRDLLQCGSISPSFSFFQLGGNSLLLIPLQYLIKDTFHVSLPMIDFAQAHTVRKMARQIEQTATAQPLDWAAETAVPEDLPLPSIPAALLSQARRQGTDLRILYTGATGHSGKYILENLVADERISKIYLVAVRATTENNNNNNNNSNGNSDGSWRPRQLAVVSDKIVQFPGNLLDERLGLSAAQFNFLAGEVDVILHSAANRSLWDHYQVLRQPSVLATQVLVGLAAPRQIPIHFMSSAAIHLFNRDAADDEYPETIAVAPPPVDGTEGYLASKWAVEKLLEKAAARFGIPMYFHRPAPVGAVQRVATETVFAEFLRVVRALRLHVTRDSIRGYIDLIVLGDLAAVLRDQLIDSASTSSSSSSPPVHYIHHRSDVRVHMGQWKAYMDQHNTDLTLDMVETEHAVEWVGRAKKIGFPYMLAAQNFDMAGVMSTLPIVQRR